MDKDEYIYILSMQRGQGLPELYSMWNNYDDAIYHYYDFLKINEYNDYIPSYFNLYKFPVGVKFCDPSEWSNVKLGRSTKYRIKFKDYKELKNEYKKIIRIKKFNNVNKS